MTGWPRDLNDGVYLLPVKVEITAPPVTASGTGGAWILAGTDAGIMYIFDHAGNLMPGWPRKVAGTLAEPFELLESGYYSFTDIISNSEESEFGEWRPESGRLRWHQPPFGEFSGPASWHSVYGGTDRDSWVQPSSGFELEQPQWADLDENLVIYPNPSSGDRVSFHFTAPGDGDATLNIFTLEGEKIIEQSMPLSGGQAEFVVQMTDQASGVYLCRIVVTVGRHDGGNEEKIRDSQLTTGGYRCVLSSAAFLFYSWQPLPRSQTPQRRRPGPTPAWRAGG